MTPGLEDDIAECRVAMAAWKSTYDRALAEANAAASEMRQAQSRYATLCKLRLAELVEPLAEDAELLIAVGNETLTHPGTVWHNVKSLCDSLKAVEAETR